MAPLLHNRCLALWRDPSGATAVEFAFAAPILITTVVAIMEFSMVLATSMVLEGAVRDASRFGITGYTADGLSRTQRIIDIVNDRTLGIIHLEGLTIDTKVYPSFAAIGQPEPFVDKPPYNHHWDPGETYTDVNGNAHYDDDMGTSGAGGPGDIVRYTVRANWPLLTNFLEPLFGSDLISLSSTMVVRNEPFEAP